MSFILDALRKSEHDRQRQSGPALAEVPIAAPKPKSNIWATAAVVLLIVNLIGVGVVLMRRASQAPAAPPAAASPATTTAPAAAAPTPASPLQATPLAASPPPAAASTPTLQPAPAPSMPPGRNPLEAEVSGRQDIDAGMAASAASVPAGPPAVTSSAAAVPGGRGTVRYEAIPEGAVSRAIAAESHAAPQRAPSPAEAALPTADELTATSGYPPLHLDLHVYSNRPQERFIFVNSHKYREGEALQEGPLVEQITPTGAVLNYRGSRFLLSRD